MPWSPLSSNPVSSSSLSTSTTGCREKGCPKGVRRNARLDQVAGQQPFQFCDRVHISLFPLSVYLSTKQHNSDIKVLIIWVIIGTQEAYLLNWMEHGVLSLEAVQKQLARDLKDFLFHANFPIMDHLRLQKTRDRILSGA